MCYCALIGLPQAVSLLPKQSSSTTTSLMPCVSWKLSRCQRTPLRILRKAVRESLQGSAKKLARTCAAPPPVLQHPNATENNLRDLAGILISDQVGGLAAAHRRDWLPALPGPKPAVLIKLRAYRTVIVSHRGGSDGCFLLYTAPCAGAGLGDDLGRGSFIRWRHYRTPIAATHPTATTKLNRANERYPFDVKPVAHHQRTDKMHRAIANRNTPARISSMSSSASPSVVSPNPRRRGCSLPTPSPAGSACRPRNSAGQRAATWAAPAW